ncbi:hypothetical protein IFU39_16395 [Paenibacillus sp. CFBP 13594]|uniref:hypothetical protein n=1 Tax=Paenibacillus sp. CFBP 13594 TaxID=2774037 RepID=UPI00178000EB|nr:hypothetical protein [Paenibacillus sp. CFBP 13594]MBD8839393.1 hypothetical protein [Paenibacillus sp. CFBP 13594]
MVKVIETNLSMVDDQIHDFQSRVIEVSSWEDFRNEFLENVSVTRKASVGSMFGITIPHGAVIENLEYSDNTLKCDIYSYSDVHTKKICYLIQ